MRPIQAGLTNVSPAVVFHANTSLVPVDVVQFLRKHTRGVLLAGEIVTPCRYVLHGGLIVFPLRSAEMEDSWTLFVPEETNDALQVMLAPAQADAAFAGIDRWSAYHGRSTERAWAAATIEGAKFGDEVFDVASITLDNPLRASERELCRFANEQHERMRTLSPALMASDAGEIRVVGVDTWGLDVQARFEIVRLEFSRQAVSFEDARALLEELIGGEPRA